MSRQVNLRLANLRTSLVNLPPILATQLTSQGILPQSLAIELSQPTSSKQPGSSTTTLYVGWSGLTTLSNTDRFPNPSSSATHQRQTGGGAIRNNVNHQFFVESIELDRTLAAHLGWKNSDRLSLKFLHRHLHHAHVVNVEPLTVDDWEILESNPQYLEDNILKQIRVVVESQKLFIWVYDKTLIQVKVNSIIPDPNNSNSNKDFKGDGSPYLINDQTEIIVCPKTRFDSIQGSSFDNKNKQILGDSIPSKITKNSNETKKKKKNIIIDLKILPQSFPLKLDSNFTTSYYDDNKTSKHGDIIMIALVNVNQFNQIESQFPTTLCSLELLLRPNQTKSTSSTVPPTEVPSSRYGHTKNLKTNKNQHEPKLDMNNQYTGASIADRVRIVPHPLVPLGFIYLSAQFKHKWFANLAANLDPRSSFLVGRPGDYEFVRIGPSKNTSADLSPSDINENLTSIDQDVMENKTEDVILLGFSEHLDFCKQFIHTSLVTGHVFLGDEYRSGNHSVSGLMICGSSGSGKTSLVKTLIEKVYLDPNVMMYSRYIDCGKHVDDRLPVLKSNITEWFDDAAWHSPSVLVLDDLDQLLPAEAEHLDSFRYRHFTEEFLSIANMAIKDKLVILVATCSSPASIHNLLRSGTHTFSETLELKGLSRNNRKEILAELIKLKAKKSGLDISQIRPEVLASEKTEGYLPSDLKDFVDRAVHQAIIRSLKNSRLIESMPVSLEMVDFETAQSGFVPISLRDIKLQKSGVNWEDVGGLTETRRILRETLEWPTKYPSVFANCPLRLRSGLLLYGYPGCGKTLLASAIAKECGLNFINIKGPELLNKYIGASEQSVRDLFQRAQAAKPCVLFFDEFESIAPKRGHDSTGVTDRVVNQLLTQMDGAEGLEGVYVLAATSRPDLIDPALLRPGRLDKSLLCSMPTKEERLDILKAVSRKLPLDESINFEELAQLTEGFTGADLQALIYSAHLEVVHESMRLKTEEVQEKKNLSSDGLSLERKNQFTWIDILPTTHGSSDQLSNATPVLSQAENESVRKRIEQVLDNLSLVNNNNNNNKSQHQRWKSNNNQHSLSPSSSQNLIEMRHVRSALGNARPSVPSTELDRLTKIYRNFVSSRSDGGLPDGQASDEIGGRASLM